MTSKIPPKKDSIEFHASVARVSTLRDYGTSVTFHLPSGSVDAAAMLMACYESQIPLVLTARADKPTVGAPVPEKKVHTMEELLNFNPEPPESEGKNVRG